MVKFFSDGVESILGKGENAGYQHFLFAHYVFKRPLSMSLKVGMGWKRVNFLQNNKIWALTKSKALAEDKLNFAKMQSSLFGRVENIVRKGENAGYQHFLLFPSRNIFPQYFQKAYFSGSLKFGIVW